jgi:hypothetical protein
MYWLYKKPEIAKSGKRWNSSVAGRACKVRRHKLLYETNLYKTKRSKDGRPSMGSLTF